MNIKIKIQSLTLAIIMLTLPGWVVAQCSQTISVIAGSGAQTYTSSGSTPGYTQQYTLANDAGIVVETNTSGTFSAANFITPGTSYTVYALNYNPADAPDPLPTVGSSVSASGSIIPGCKNTDYETDYLCINVIECTPICQGDIISGSSSGSAAGYVQEYLLVDAIGNIIAIDDIGAANISTAGLPVGTYTLHALNYNPTDPPVPAADILVAASAVGSMGGCFNADFTTDFICFTLVAPANAGADATATACTADMTLDANTLLSGADPGGIWSEVDGDPAFNTMTGMLDLTTAASPVTIVYTVNNGVCPIDASSFIVTISSPMSSGTAAAPVSVDNCATSANITGSDLLTGEDPGGTWSAAATNPPGATFDATTGTFTVAGAPVGTYEFTYTIADGVCLGSSTMITVNVTVCPITTTETVSGTIYIDDNGIPGYQAGEEVTGGGMTVTIYEDIDSSGTFTVGDILVTVVPVDTTGNWTVDLDSPGNYVVVIGGTLPPGYNPVDASTAVVLPSGGAGTFIALEIVNAITMGAITALADCNEVLLNWTTGTESNTTYFLIQRSIDGYNFTTVGTISAAGSSSTTINYYFNDKYSVASVVYYRIVTLHTDGTVINSNVISVMGECNESVTLSNLFPNPVMNILNFDLTTNIDQFVKVTIMDVTGRVHNTQLISIVNGRNRLQMNTSKLANGIYFLHISTTESNFTHVEKFVKGE